MNNFKDILKNIDSYSNDDLLEIFVEFRGALKGFLSNYKPGRKEKDLLDIIEVFNELLIKKLKECKGEQQ